MQVICSNHFVLLGVAAVVLTSLSYHRSAAFIQRQTSQMTLDKKAGFNLGITLNLIKNVGQH